MTQTELLLEPPRARRTDPATSHDAAEKALEFAASHAALIWNALCAMPDGGTIADLERVTRLDKVQCARRLAAMERKGTVKRNRIDWTMRRGVAVEVYEQRAGYCVWRAVRAS